MVARYAAVTHGVESKSVPSMSNTTTFTFVAPTAPLLTVGTLERLPTPTLSKAGTQGPRFVLWAKQPFLLKLPCEHEESVGSKQIPGTQRWASLGGVSYVYITHQH